MAPLEGTPPPSVLSRMVRWGAIPGTVSAGGAWALGLVLILSLWAASGYDVLQRMSDVEQQASEVNERFVRLEELLARIRESVLLGSIYLRDALLESDPARVAFYREQLIENRRRWTAVLDEYQRVAASSPEQEALSRLRAELDVRWKALLPLVDTAAAEGSLEARARLRAYVIPRRELILRISEQAHAINREAFARQQMEIAQLYRSAQQRAWITGAVALLLSLGIAVVVVQYAGRLEARLREQMEKDAQNARDLKYLSSKLVQAQEDERRHIARELHDEVGQALSGVKTELAVTERRLEAAGASSRHLLDDARDMTDRALRSVRDLSQLLRPAVLDDIGLVAATESLLRSFSQREGIKSELVVEGMKERLAPTVETCVYRIVQEALTNVARHSEATRCQVSLRRQPRGMLQVTVTDNGKGFGNDSDRGDHRQGLGLLGIRERTAEFGGRLQVDTASGRGTTLTVDLPAVNQAPDEVRAGLEAECPGGAP